MKEHDKLHKNDLRFTDLTEIFETMFNKKGYSKDKLFNQTVWFLKDDDDFLAKKNKSMTPGVQTGNFIHDTIIDLSKQKNLTSFSVPVGAFIERLSLELLECEDEVESNELTTEITSDFIPSFVKGGIKVERNYYNNQNNNTKYINNTKTNNFQTQIESIVTNVSKKNKTEIDVKESKRDKKEKALVGNYLL